MPVLSEVFKCWLSHLPAEWPYTSFLPSLSFSFFIGSNYMTGFLIMKPFQGNHSMCQEHSKCSIHPQGHQWRHKDTYWLGQSSLRGITCLGMQVLIESISQGPSKWTQILSKYHSSQTVHPGKMNWWLPYFSFVPCSTKTAVS